MRCGDTPSVLLIDDEEDVLPEYQDFLELNDLAAEVCADPLLAVEIVLAQPNLKVVVTDLRMAKLDGASLIRLLRKSLPEQRRVEFIILTGDATMQGGSDLDDVPIFIKPSDTDALLAAIRAALAASS